MEQFVSGIVQQKGENNHKVAVLKFFIVRKKELSIIKV